MTFSRKAQRAKSVKAHWQSDYALNAADYETVLAQKIPWTSWALNANPETSAEVQFEAAVMILSGDGNRPLAERYLDLALEMIQRIIDEDRLTGSIDFPRNQAQMNRTRVYAESMKSGSWNSDLLRAASRDYESYCRETFLDPDEWHSQVQYYYLNAVRLALLGDDVERAQALLESPPHPLKDQREHARILKGLVRLIRNEFTADERTKFLEEYEAYFDRLRDPREDLAKHSFIEPSMAPLELALLWERYVARSGEPIDWTRVIENYAH